MISCDDYPLNTDRNIFPKCKSFQAEINECNQAKLKELEHKIQVLNSLLSKYLS
jgi:hypothetical protein